MDEWMDLCVLPRGIWPNLVASLVFSEKKGATPQRACATLPAPCFFTPSVSRFPVICRHDKTKQSLRPHEAF